MSYAIRRAPTAFEQASPISEVAERQPEFLRWLREQNCLVTGTQTGDVIAHHVRLRRSPSGQLQGYGQMGKRVPDWQCVPLSDHIHQHAPDALHKGSEKEWWAKYGLDPLRAASVLFDMHQHGVRGPLNPDQFNTVLRVSMR